MRVSYGPHAEEMLAERLLDREWVERAIRSPDSVEPDLKHPDRIRAFKAIPERDGRVIRVVYVGKVTIVASSQGVRLGVVMGLHRLRPRSRKSVRPVRAGQGRRSEEERPGVVLDFDAEGRIVAVEVLDASEHLAKGADLKALSAA